MRKHDNLRKVSEEEKTGINILKRALEEPIRQIVQNAGIDGAVIVNAVKKEGHGFGFNAETLTSENLTEAGIVDPVKVVRSSLQNAASAASMFLTTEVVVAEKPEEKKNSANPMAQMPQMGY